MERAKDRDVGLGTLIAMSGRSMHAIGERTVGIKTGVYMPVAHVPIARATLQGARIGTRLVMLADTGGGHDYKNATLTNTINNKH